MRRLVKLLICYFVVLCIFFWLFYNMALTSQKFYDISVIGKITLFFKIIIFLLILRIIDFIGKKIIQFLIYKKILYLLLLAYYPL
ncbi:hypothetical protein B6A27_02040 [Anoxybacillus sp. UARK-01]|nr:hypothetical protein B6A27_02040 [Anoxybacillus sp. UARK-01]